MAIGRQGKGLLATATALLVAHTPAAAQQVKPPGGSAYDRAIAAGYKALTLCNGIFVAHRTEQQVAADELSGIYPEYDAIVPTLPALVLQFQGLVEVSWSPTMEPRTASWSQAFGCVLRPIGVREPLLIPEGIGNTYPAAGPDVRAWPVGDDGVRPRPAAPLANAVAAAFDGTYGAGSKTTGVVVVRDGAVVAERYAAGWGPFTPNRTWSAAKSLTGTLIGVAGLDPAKPPPIAAWRQPEDPRAAITLDQLLRMASGLHSGAAGNRTDAIYFGGVSVDEEATAWPLEAKPGTRFRYANDDNLLAALALRSVEAQHPVAIGYTPFSVADGLLGLLGMRNTKVGRDPHGNYILSSQVWSTARDLARLGQFWLQDGVWQGKRLLPEGWMRYMTAPSGPQPADGPGYGATMWLFGAKQGLPDGSYAAQGNRGQYVMVIPSAKLVVVRRGEDGGSARFDIARFTADVLAAVR